MKFSTSPDKEADARALGAHHFVNSRDSDALGNLSGSLDMILVTVNAELDWDSYLAALRPKGTLHLVGAAPKIEATVFPMIAAQRLKQAAGAGR